MRPIVLLVALFAVVLATKERYQDGNTNTKVDDLTQKLWLEIKKRLKDYDKPDALDDHNSAQPQYSQCHSEMKLEEGRIIRTKDSQDAGATFIDSPTVDSRNGCLDECCAETSCNLAVYKAEGDDHSCYLFDCGTPNICQFTDHPGFEVMSLPKRTSENKEQAKHESALQNLAASSDTPAPEYGHTPTPDYIEKQPAPLFGECKTHKDCAGTWTTCNGGYCLCQEGYHAQDGVCRKDCNRFEFECANEGQPLVYPQCIAIYDKCDGILHCKDGSDERNCAADNGKDNGDGTKNTDKSAIGHHNQPFHSTSPPQNVNKPTSRPTTEKYEPVKTSDKLELKTIPPPSITAYKNIEKSPKGDDVHSKASDTDHSEGEIIAGKDYKNAEYSEKSEGSKNEIKDQNQPKVEVAQKHSSLLEEAEESDVDEDYMSPSNKGAVVALALGLGITAVLLVFVGCRLRNVKRRLRRGRPLNSNEADYLVNGMYL